MRTRMLILMLLLQAAALRAATPQEYPCYRLKSAPEIDGKLDDAAWADLPEASGFHILGKDIKFALEKQTSFKAGWLGDSLYLAVRCDEPEMKKMKASTQDGGNLWDEDSIELFFMPPGNTQLMQLIANSVGARWNGEDQKILDWQAKGGVSGDTWTLEVKIPFAVIRQTPSNGSRWPFSIARDLTTGPASEKCTCWPPLKKGFSEVSNFGVLLFKDQVVDAQSRQADDQALNAPRNTWVKTTGATLIKDINENKELNAIFKDWNLQMEANPLKIAMDKLEALLAAKEFNAAAVSRSIAECQQLRGKLEERAVALGIIESPVSEKRETTVLPLTIRVRDAVVKVLVNGEEMKGDTITLKEGLNVIGIATEATGTAPGIAVSLPGHPEAEGRWRAGTAEVDGWKGAKFDDGNWPVSKMGADGFMWSAAATDRKVCFRQVLLWNKGHDGPNRCLLPLIREWGFSEDSVESLFLALYSPLPFPLEGYEFVLDMPMDFALMEKEKGYGENLHNRRAQEVKEERAKHDGLEYRRYRLSFTGKEVTPDTLHLSLLPVKLGKYAGKDKLTKFYFQRLGRDNFTELEQCLPVRVLPAINGRMPSKIMISQYCSIPWGYSRLSKEHLEAHVRDSEKAGFNYWVMGGDVKKDPYLARLHELVTKGGGRLIMWSNWPLYGVSEGGPKDNNELLQWLKATPEAHARYFEDSQSWEKNAMFCPEYASGPGAAKFREGTKARFQRNLAALPDVAVIWADWETAPWVAASIYESAPTGQGSWCFCERCKKAFRAFAKIPGDKELADAVIFKEYNKEWSAFRSDQDGRVVGEVQKACHELNKPYMMYSWTVHRKFWEACEGRIDLAFPGCPGNGVADADGQRHLDETMAFFREKVGMPRAMGQRFSFFFSYDMKNQKDFWKRWMVLSNDGYVNAKSWKPQILRIVASLHGGVDLQSSMECVGGMKYYIGEAMRIICEHEDLFWEGERVDDLAESDQLKYPNLLVLKKGAERLVLLFNESKNPLEVSLRNKNLVQGQKARVNDASALIDNPGAMNITVEPEDVAVVHIK